MASQDSPGRPAQSPARLRRWIIGVGTVALGAIVASSLYDIWRARHELIVDEERELVTVGRALAEQLEGSLQSIDLVLRTTADWYATLSSGVASEVVETGLAARAAEVPQIALLTITDASGVRRFRSMASAATDFSVADREYFIVQQDRANAGVFASGPILTRSDGRISFVLSRRLAGPDGRFTGVIAAIVELAEFQQFYRAINLGTGSAISLLRNDGTLILREPVVEGIAGQSYPELLARSAASGSATSLGESPMDGTVRLASITPVDHFPLSIGVARKIDDVLAPWRGNLLHVAGRTLLILLFGVAAIVVLTRQLARLDRNQRELRESEERYALAMEGASEGHFDWNLEGGTSFLSRQMKLLHGRDPDEPTIEREEWVSRLNVHPDDLERGRLAVREHFAGRTDQFESEYRVVQQDGQWHWLHVRARCLRDSEGNVRRFAGSVVDITPRKAAETDRERLEQQLRQAQRLEAMGTLASGIAHDFNNILGAILGYGELAYRAIPEGNPGRRHLDNVIAAGVRAKALVERILAFSRSSMGESGLVQVEAVVREVTDLLGTSLPDGVRLDAELQAGTAAIVGDATQLHQVVMNLCTNAVDAMPGGGVLKIELDRVDLASSCLLSNGQLAAGSYVRLRVTDSGSGIPPDVLERIFDPFFTTKEVGRGTGLGLSLVHALVADLHGAIDVVTEVDRGTTFAVWLPRAAELASALLDSPDDALPRGQGQSILLVDNEVALVALYEELLAELGYEPVGFSSSTAALAAFAASPGRFDAVLTDEVMPELSGSALAAAIREIRPDMPIVLMSGYGGPEVRARVAGIGIAEVLQKPLARADIAHVMRRLLGVTPSNPSAGNGARRPGAAQS